MIVLDPSMMDGVENITNLPYVVQYDNYDKDALVDVLKREMSEESVVHLLMIPGQIS